MEERKCSHTSDQVPIGSYSRHRVRRSERFGRICCCTELERNKGGDKLMKFYFFDPIATLFWYVGVIIFVIVMVSSWYADKWFDAHPVASKLILIGIIVVQLIPFIVRAIKYFKGNARKPKQKVNMKKALEKKSFALLHSDSLIQRILPVLQKLDESLQFGPAPEANYITLPEKEAREFAEQKIEEIQRINDGCADYSIASEYDDQVLFFEMCWEKVASKHPERLIAKYSDLIKRAINLSAVRTKESLAYDKLFTRREGLWNEMVSYYEEQLEHLEYGDEEVDLLDYTKVISHFKELTEKVSLIAKCQDAMLSLGSIHITEDNELAYWEAGRLRKKGEIVHM